MVSANVTRLILTAVVCGSSVILCVIVSYLCLSVWRIRRKLDEVTGNGTQYIITNKGPTEGNRYTVDAVPKQPRVPSVVYPDPHETVTFLNRGEIGGGAGLMSSGLPGEGLAFPSSLSQSPEPASCTQNVANTPVRSERVLLEFANKGFSPDNRLSCGSVTEEDAESSQLIHSNREMFTEEPIYQNNNQEEMTYQNTGELRDINNPEWDPLCKTMNITDVR